MIPAAANRRDVGSAGRTAVAERPLHLQLRADSAELLRPETLDLLRKIAASSAVEECPVNLTRAEVRSLLGLVENRWAIARAWARTLELCLRYARIARRIAEHTGCKDYADWLARRRIEPIRRLHEELVAEPASPPVSDDNRFAEAG